MKNVLFEINTPIGCRVRTTEDYWDLIIQKHPDVGNHLEDVKKCLQAPYEIRKSRSDDQTLLFYHPIGKYVLTVVVKKINGDGFIITAYRTDTLKEGEVIWASSK